ncbi:MAG: hypothetical protein AAGD22_00840 [Verrucomicrobiota bacterium]
MDEFVPVTGRLGQLLVDQTEGLPHLEFSIEVEFAEGEFDDETGSPFLRISHLRPAHCNSWKSISRQAWKESSENTPSQLDAVVLLFGMPNPAEIQTLQLGEILGTGTVPTDLQLVADFESEAYRDSLDAVPITLEAFPLSLEPLRVSTRMEKQFRGDDAATREAVASVVDLAEYGPLEKIPGGYGFPPILPSA